MKSIFQLVRNRAVQSAPVNLVRNATDATLYLYDEISAEWGIGAKDVIAAIGQLSGETLNIRINSPGGNVFEGQAICEAIRRYEGKTVAHIDSLAASAASSIAIAADEVEMAAGAFLMIHNTSGLVWGDKTDMRSTADVLEQVEGAIMQEYATKTGKTTEELAAWMDAETWFTADEALANGFVDRIAKPSPKVKNTWNLADVFKHAPEQLSEPAEQPDFNPHFERVQAINRSRVAHLAPRQ